VPTGHDGTSSQRGIETSAEDAARHFRSSSSSRHAIPLLFVTIGLSGSAPIGHRRKPVFRAGGIYSYFDRRKE